MSEARQRTLDVLEALVELLVQPREHLPLSSRTDERSQQLAESLAREFGLLPPLPIEDDMATVKYSIGTSSRDYSTIAAWEADLDNSGLYSSGDVARGELYNDSVFDESVLINGGGTVGLASVTLTAAAGERHDGTAGTGARIVISVGADQTVITHGRTFVTTSWIEIDGNGVSVRCGWNDTNSNDNDITNCIVHGARRAGFCEGIVKGRRGTIANCIVYDWQGTAEFASTGIAPKTGFGSHNVYCVNCTSHDNESASGGGKGIDYTDSTNHIIKNCIATSNGTDYTAAATAGAASHNLSSDATASGTGSLTSKTAANQFVSIVGGSEDLHLKTGADAIDAGTDLGTTPTGVNIDIDGRDRDLEGDTWDMGADEFVSAAAATMTFAQIHFSPFSGGLA